MSKFFAVKQLGVLKPADAVSEAALAKIGNGALIEIEVKQRRNVKHHRKYWALVNFIFEHQPEPARYASTEDVHNALKIACGLRTQIELPGNVIGFIAGSIAFHKMDQTAFNEFYDRACDAVAKYFVPGLTSETVKREVEDLIGVAA